MQRDGGPGGAGGAGNPVGGSFTGAAQALELVGNHCYAYSGGFTTSNSGYVTLLSFTTGNFYTVANITYDGATTDDDPAAGLRSNFKVKMNGTVIANYHSVTQVTFAGVGGAAASTDVIPILIPPYTEIVVSNRATANTGTVFVQLVGRIYRGR